MLGAIRYEYHRLEGGGGEGGRGFLGVLKFFEVKMGDGNNFWRQEVGMQFFLDAIERWSICNIVYW